MVFIERPGYAQSFPLPFADAILGTIGLPSFIVLEKQRQLLGPGGLSTWVTESSIALPLPPEMHRTMLRPALMLQRGYQADTVTSGGIRGGDFSFEGSAGLAFKLGWDDQGNVVYAQGQALSANIRAWIANYANEAKGAGGESVRLVARNIDQGDAYICIPTILDWSRGHREEYQIAYGYSVEFEIASPVEPDPLLPEWLQAVEDAFQTYQSAALIAAGYMEVLAVLATSVGRIIGSAVDTLVTPIREFGNTARDLGTGIRSIYTQSLAAGRNAVDAVLGTGRALREMSGIITGSNLQPRPVSPSTLPTYASEVPKWATATDPSDDPNREVITPGVLADQQTIGEAVAAIETVQLAISKVVEPSRNPPYIATAADSIHTLPGKLGLTPESLMQSLGGETPVVDGEAILPHSIWPGSSLAPDSDGQGIGQNAGDGTSGANLDVLYGVNFELSPDGDLVPEDGPNPKDVRLVAGEPNLNQGLRITLETIRGRNLTFPLLGIRAPIGEPNYLAPLAAAANIEALLQDDRVRSVKPLFEETDGDRLNMALQAQPWGESGPVNLE